MSVNLTYLLKRYKPTEAKMDSDEGLEQQRIGKKLCNILAKGANQLNPIQLKAVKKFKSKFSESNPNDIVIKVVNELIPTLEISEKVSKMMPNLPIDIQVAIDVYKDVSTLMDISTLNDISKLIVILTSKDRSILTKNLSEKMLIKLNKLEHMLNIAVHAKCRLSDAASEDAALNYSDLLQFTKVIVGFGFLLLDNDALKKIVRALIDIKEMTDSKDKLASEFLNMANIVIKEHEAKHLPPALVKQFEMCIAYHGKAINDGIITIQKELLKTGKLDQTLLSFAEKYCMDHLLQNQYLVRLSSRFTNDIEKERSFVVTISYYSPIKGMSHVRVTCIDHSKGGHWVKEKELLKEGEKPPSYETLEDLIKATLEDYKPCPTPSPSEAETYVNVYIKKNL